MVRKEASFISIATAMSLLVGSLGGGMYVGALANDVETLKAEQEQVEEIKEAVQGNTETLIAVTTTQTYIIAEQAKQDKKLDKIIEKLEEL